MESFFFGLHQAQTLNPMITLYLENQTNAAYHLNIGSLKTAIEEEWNKTSEEFISKACWYNNWKKVAILSKFTVFETLFLRCCLFF